MISLTSAALPDNSSERSRPAGLMRCPYRLSKTYFANDWRRENPTPALQRSSANKLVRLTTSGIISVAPMRSFGKSRPQRRCKMRLNSSGLC
jgi:hypothetical protein